MRLFPRRPIPHNALRATLALLYAGAVTCACGPDPNRLLFGDDPSAAPPSGPDASAADAGDPPTQTCTAKPPARAYIGFDGTDMVAGRADQGAGVDRARIKPYRVLAAEYERAIGRVPASLAGAAGSFDEPPARWFSEPRPTGVSLSAVFDIAFEGCVALTRDTPEYAMMPNTASAAAECGARMRAAWSRAPAPGETAACALLATTQLASEPSPRRRWAYVCASILSSSNFLTF